MRSRIIGLSEGMKKHVKESVLSGALSIAAVCHGLGISLPMVLIEGRKVWKVPLMRDKTASVIDLARDMWVQAEHELFLIIIAFSVLFPIFKIIGVHTLLHGDAPSGRLGKALHMFGKWSMAEVFLVAIIIYAVKTAGPANVVSQPGLWFYAAAIFLTAICGFSAAQLKDRQ